MIGDLALGLRRGADDRTGSRQGEAGGQYGDASQRGALRLGQKFIAPVKRRAQRSMPGQRRAAPVGEQTETVIDPGGEFFHPKRRRAGGGELDGQRNAVKVATYFHHGLYGPL